MMNKSTRSSKGKIVLYCEIDAQYKCKNKLNLDWMKCTTSSAGYCRKCHLKRRFGVVKYNNNDDDRTNVKSHFYGTCGKAHKFTRK